MQALLLGAEAPESDEEFLYAPQTQVTGLARRILAALSLPADGRVQEEVLAELQKRGLYLTYALECPVEARSDTPALTRELLERNLPHVIARVRRSLKPKRALLLSPQLQQFLPQLESTVGCPVFYTPLAGGASGEPLHDPQMAVFRAALPALAAHDT